MSRYEMLLDCWRSGQMTDRQLEAHKRAEPLFAAWLARRGY